ncbi:MAG TPA: four helix bundle protein [Candidatus Acidoferrales bacterium]|nr:four helix bundle protein [Candidatus Acidoferrales bacterium]
MTSDGQKARSYRDLIVWQKAIVLVKGVYEITARFPAEEKFGLTSQMRRAAVSVPSNIAEGQARKSTREFVQFLSNAEGSLAELDTQVVLGSELGFVRGTEASTTAAQIDELGRMLNSLRRKLTVARAQ